MLPTVRQAEFGFPVALKVTAAGRSGEEGSVNRSSRTRPELEQCVHLLCDDPEVASHLLESSLANATRS